MSSLFEGRESDSPYIEAVWRGRAGSAYAPVCPASNRWHLLFLRQNSRLVKDQIAEEIESLKQQPGLDLMIFGSPRLTHTFIHLGLIDEYRFFLNPIVLGGGIPLFQDIKDWMKLKLLEAKTFQAGVVGLHYQAVRQ